MQGRGSERTKVSVCLGTNCYLKGSQDVLNSVLHHAQETGLENRLDVRAAFCLEQCEHGPNATIDGECMHHCTSQGVIDLLNSRIENEKKGES